MTVSLPSVTTPPPNAILPHARRQTSGAGDFAGHLPTAKRTVGAGAPQKLASSVDSAALVSVSAYSDEPPRRRRPSQAVVGDALDALRRVQVLLLQPTGGDLELEALQSLASELEEAADDSLASRGILLRLKVEIAKRTPFPAT
ncbi:hypothetical protein J8J14_24290 [Roseomonas sp. SSH11]|uniref:Class II flagellar assembly regulator n=2 Tax=Pararoseomonas baculiformis TaxID=2820812 RepID=A0ABS4ALG0_9PROT|nr:hypothetical protein [Pararoseomonas baculiformis]